MMVVSWQWVVPKVGAEIATQSTFLEQRNDDLKGIVHELNGETSQKFYASRFDPVAHHLTVVSLLVWGDLAADTFMINGDAADWDAERRDWKLVAGVRDSRVGTEPVEWLGRSDLSPTAIVK